MRTVLLALGVAVVLVLAACGGDNGGDDPRQVAERFIAARADNDGQAMCELLTAEAQAAAAQNSEDGSCADGMALNEGDSDIQEFSYYTVESVDVAGDTASAYIAGNVPGDTDNDESGTLPLVKTDDGWRVDLPGSE